MAKEKLVNYSDPYLSAISSSVSQDICILLEISDRDNSKSRFFRSESENLDSTFCSPLSYPKLLAVIPRAWIDVSVDF